MGKAAPALLLWAIVAGAAAPVAARDALGIFGSWGAFRDASPARCFAISRPGREHQDARFRAFATVATWPGARVRGQIHVRLRKPRLPDAPILLEIGERRFPMVGGGGDAWAPDSRADGAIVAAMRSGSSMSISTQGENGRSFADVYRLRGAATAIDASALGCARLR